MSQEAPDYQAFNSAGDVEEEILKRRELIVRKCKLKEQTEESKKASNAGFRDVLKELKEDITFQIEVIDQLESRKKELMGSKLLKIKEAV